MLITALIIAALGAGPEVPPPSLRIGDRAPAIDISHFLRTPGGVTSVTPGDGAIYVIDFWATWCAPCIAGFPAMGELQKRFAADGVVVVALSDEPVETVEPFLARPFRGGTHADRMPFVVATDPDASVRTGVLEAASAFVIPQSVVIDRDGALVWIGHPETDDLETALEQIVAGSWDPAPWRDAFESRRAFGLRFDALVAAERWEDAAAMVADDWSRLNDIAWRITLNQGNAIQNRDLDLADRLAAEAFAKSGETAAFPLHVRAAIAFERGDVAGAAALERKAVEIEPADGAWAGYYRQTLARYEKALAGS